jgi:hypothetical protein
MGTLKLSELNIPAAEDVAAARVGKPLPKGDSRSAVKSTKDTADAKQLKAWQRAVFKADGFCCRKCGVKVVQTITMQPNQAQAHHVKGRTERAVRYDVRNGLTLCRTCHEQITGAVNERWIVLATKVFTVVGKVYTNAREKVTFRRVA